MLLRQKITFFSIQSAQNDEVSQYLIRDGAFYLSEDPGNAELLTLVTSEGDYVLDQAGNRINLPVNFSSIQLNAAGQLIVTLDDGTEENVGQLGLIAIFKPQLLESLGGNAFQFPDLAELGYAEEDVFAAVAATESRLVQHALEGSNVDVSKEMNELLMTQRHYQFNSRSLSIADQMAGLVNGIRG